MSLGRFYCVNSTFARLGPNSDADAVRNSAAALHFRLGRSCGAGARVDSLLISERLFSPERISYSDALVQVSAAMR